MEHVNGGFPVYIYKQVAGFIEIASTLCSPYYYLILYLILQPEHRAACTKIERILSENNLCINLAVCEILCSILKKSSHF